MIFLVYNNLNSQNIYDLYISSRIMVFIVCFDLG